LEVISPKEKKRTHPNIRVRLLKRRRRRRFLAWWPMEGKGEGSWLGGQWKEEEKVLGLVANGRRKRMFLAWWPMEGKGKGFWLGGQWKEKEKVFGLVANGRKRRRFFSTFSTFPPSNFT
jgi:hypothetical protein